MPKDSLTPKRSAQGISLFRLFLALLTGKLSGWSYLIVFAAIAYTILPVDLIPDVAPFIGVLDDAGVVAFAVNYLRNDIDRALRED